MVLGQCCLCGNPVSDRTLGARPTFLILNDGQSQTISHRSCFDKKGKQFQSKFTLGIENGLPTAKIEVTV